MVKTKDNRSFTLIKCLPFNTMDYTDVTIVLKQKLSSTFFKIKQEKYTIKNIVFKYHFENEIKSNTFLDRLLSTPYVVPTRENYKKLADTYTMLSMRATPGETPYDKSYEAKKKLFVFMLGLFLFLVVMVILCLEISLFKSEALNADIFKPYSFSYDIQEH